LANKLKPFFFLEKGPAQRLFILFIYLFNFLIFYLSLFIIQLLHQEDIEES